MVKARDRRFTVSVAADVAERLDYRVRTNANANRSALVEEALRVWETLAEYPDKQKTLNQALELYEKEQEREIYRSYYSELSESAKAEDYEFFLARKRKISSMARRSLASQFS